MEPIVRILFNECCHYTENSKKKKKLHLKVFTVVLDGQGGLACCNSWGRKESDTTEQLI